MNKVPSNGSSAFHKWKFRGKGFDPMKNTALPFVKIYMAERKDVGQHYIKYNRPKGIYIVRNICMYCANKNR